MSLYSLLLTTRPTGPFEPDWDLHPSVVLGTTVLAALYWYGIGPWRRRQRLPPASPWRVLSYASGLVVMLVALNGPIHHLSDYYLFSAHMVQHLLLQLVLPPLLIAGLPGWLVEPLVAGPRMRHLGRTLAHPLVAGGLFSVMIAAWHVVPSYELMMRNHNVHIVTHLLFMVTAVIMWWPVMSPVAAVPRLSPGVAMLYLFLVGIPMQAVAAIITFADEPLYQWYVEAPRTWGLSPLADQQLGGLIMWVPGNLWMWGAIALVFFKWARQEAEVAGLGAGRG